MKNDAKATNTDNITNCGYTVSPTVLSLEEILKDAVRRKATYQVQFADYDLNTWTTPVELTQNRMDKLLNDGSIRKVRLEFEM
jgi:hypothetical protein